MTRGVVISNPVRPTADGAGISLSSGLDPQELRAWTLFYDKLDFPQNNAIHIGIGADGEFLEKAGVLQRTKVNISGGFKMTADMWAEIHLAAFKHLDASEPGIWSLARSERSFAFPDTELQDQRGLLVKLTKCVPVPDADVPLEEVLNFREARKDELFALRSHIEAVYQGVLSAPDRPLAESAAVKALQRGIQDQLRVSRGSGLSFKLADLSARFNFVPFVITSITGYELGLGLGGALLVGGLGGLGGAAVAEIQIGPSWKWKLRSEQKESPFEYVVNIHNELVWT